MPVLGLTNTNTGQVILKDSVQQKLRRVKSGCLSMGLSLGLWRWAVFCHFIRPFSIFLVSISSQYCPNYRQVLQ
jgi:hypothetical protein